MTLGRLWHPSRLLTRAQNRGGVSAGLAPSGILDRCGFADRNELTWLWSDCAGRHVEVRSVSAQAAVEPAGESPWSFGLAGPSRSDRRFRGRPPYRCRLGGSSRRGAASGKDPCGIPTTAPVWIDYAEGSVAPDVRALFAQPGVVVTASGTVIPKTFRDHGRRYDLLRASPADPRRPAGRPERSGVDRRDRGRAVPARVGLDRVRDSDRSP